MKVTRLRSRAIPSRLILLSHPVHFVRANFPLSWPQVTRYPAACQGPPSERLPHLFPMALGLIRACGANRGSSTSVGRRWYPGLLGCCSIYR
ncbi:hypothetical protein BDV12DRAFT_86478 [Aspergillus spectabilis]